MKVKFKINSVEKTSDELGISSATITKKCSSADELKLTFSSTANASQISVGDKIEAFVGNIRKFCGHVTRIPITLSGKSQKALLIARNAWGDMEEIVYQQPWKRFSGNTEKTVLRSKVILGQNEDGDEINVGQQIRDIVTRAQLSGADFEIGTIDIDNDMLLDEARDLSCAQAILRALKWAPNAVIFFDYSNENTPIFNAIKRNSIDNELISLNNESVLSLSVTERPDLALKGVSIKYERENNINGNSRLEVFEENYPQDLSSEAKGVLVMSVDLDGRRATTNSYQIECETINLESPQWWINHIPSLKNEDFTILETSITNETLKRELVKGSIVSGMNFETERATARATIRYTSVDGSILTKDIATNILTTNAFTGTYQITKTSQYAENVKTGLAKSIYDTSKETQFEGSISILNATSREFIAKRLNIESQTNPNWATMNSTVVSVEENLGEKISTLKFGPPKHLYPDQISELFRINRTRKVSDTASTRVTSTISSGGDLTSQTPIENGTEGDVSYERLLLSGSGNIDGVIKSIDINAADVGEDETAKMREIYLCHNGYLAKGKVLMTEPTNESTN